MLGSLLTLSVLMVVLVVVAAVGAVDVLDSLVLDGGGLKGGNNVLDGGSRGRVSVGHG